LKKEKPSGILNVDKPLGLSSHDVVERVRALTDVRRTGHAGTLDPLATGVLVVCVGRMATRVVEYLMDAPKVYRADVLLGVVTDTFDAEGEVLATCPVDVGREEVESALAEFRGAISQIPPMYSAVKHRGKPLYKLARRGIEVEREPRRVEIYRLELVAWEPSDDRARCTLEVECSAGTYVRVLVHDFGQKLRCGAYVTDLIRLASGDFHLEDAISLDRFARAAEEARWPDLLQPVDRALAPRFPPLYLDADEARRLCSGQSLSRGDEEAEDEALARAYGPEGRFLALAAYDRQESVWRPHKVFLSPYPGHDVGDDD
jgi:tRNA pseudouridine55 synthase